MNPLDYKIQDPDAMRYALMQDAGYKKGGIVKERLFDEQDKGDWFNKKGERKLPQGDKKIRSPMLRPPKGMRFPVTDPKMEKDEDFSKFPIKKVPVEELYSIQNNVREDNLKPERKHGKPIHVVIWKGKYWVVDGNHRASEFWAANEKHIHAHVLNLDEHPEMEKRIFGEENVKKYAGGGKVEAEPTVDEMRWALDTAPEYSPAVPDVNNLNQPTQGQLQSQIAERGGMVPGQSLADFVAADYARRLQNTMETPQRLAETVTGSSMGLDPTLGMIGDVGKIPSLPQMKAGLRLAGEQGIEAARPLHEAYMSGNIPGLVDPALNVVKNKGGNWLPGSVEKNLEPLKGSVDADINALQGFDPPHPHIANWIDKRLTPYVKNEMGTPGDPIRALAENGVLHYTPATPPPGNLEQAVANRFKSGNDTEGLGKSQLAREWEMLSDASIRGESASKWRERASASVLEKMPWIDKLDASTPIYERTNPDMRGALGFDHLVDELRNATGGDVNIPQHLRIDPAKLERMSVPDAVNKVAAINEWRIEQAGKTALETVAKLPEAMPSTDPKFTWRNLNNPEDAALSKGAHEAVGKDMGICIGGSEYIKRAAKGEADHISLFDDKGHPHIAIESRPTSLDSEMHHMPAERRERLKAQAAQQVGLDPTNLDKLSHSEFNAMMDVMDTLYVEQYGTPKANIYQVKGKGNNEPAPKYREQLKQFLNSREWGDVRETGGLIDTHDSIAVSSQMSKLRVPIATSKVDALVAKMQPTLPRFITADDLKAALKVEGYAQGGQVKKPVSTLVNTKYNADDMRYALLQRKG